MIRTAAETPTTTSNYITVVRNGIQMPHPVRPGDVLEYVGSFADFHGPALVVNVVADAPIPAAAGTVVRLVVRPLDSGKELECRPGSVRPLA